ncbi:GumC family protein [Thalassomonas sp. M1454]|uniref:GumC family protein n=1 Tax=Thalassomonas sp. M1454 TaxID=2594477 RepID=UPI00117F9F7E|nr:polysaccharide biosynthesis tyrosine autokinase [Thalassomonas sp. M1454]TRX57216.1 polysaccharide biosynthesis tyrosine autokinase [Thalassomonas sp. M1454]
MSEQFPNQNMHNDEIDLKHLWQIIYRSKWRIIALSVVVTLFAIIFAQSRTPIYVASSTLLIEQEQSKVVELNDIYNEADSRQEYYYTQLEIITSTPIAEKVVTDLNLVEHPLFNQPPKPKSGWQKFKELLNPPKPRVELSKEQQQQQKFDSIVGYILGGISASPISKTELVVISFQSHDPEFAALAANGVAQAYINNHMEVNLQRVEKSAVWLNRSLSGLKEKLTAAENRLQDFEEDNSLVDLGGIKSLAAKEIEERSKNVLTAQKHEKEIEQVYQLLNENKGDLAVLANLPEVQDHPNLKVSQQKKREVEKKILELSVTYGPKHPKMIAANAEQNKVLANINEQVQRLIATIGSDYRKAQRATKRAQDAVEQAKNKYQKLTRVDSTRRELKQDVETNSNLYQAFFKRLKETAELQGFETSVGRVVDPATVPYGPSKPNKKLIVVLAFMLSVMVGVGATLLLEAFNSTIRSVEDIESKLHSNLLGIVPLVGSHIESKSEQKKLIENLDHYYYFNGNDHAFSEAIRTLRTSLQLLNLDKKVQVIAVTSTIPSEGKTLVTSNLAFTSAQLEKTIIIDTDLRKPKVAKNFKLSGPGLSDYIAGNVSLDDCIKHDEQGNVDVITAGTLPPNPQELLASNQFKTLINELKTRYQKILIDTPPILAVSDAMIVAKQADTLVYVVRASSTKESQIKASLKRLQQSNIRLGGVVLNQVDLQKAMDYEEFSGYYDQYGYNS